MEGTIAQVIAGEATWCMALGESVRRDGIADLSYAVPDGSIDHVIADYPYSPEVHFKSRGSGARKTALGHQCVREREFGFEHLTAAMRRGFAKETARVCKRWTLAFCDVESVHLWRRSFLVSGLEPVRTGFWVKEACTPQLTGDRPAVACEAIVIAHRPGRKRWNAGGKRGIWSHRIVGGGEHNAAEVRVHTAQKPIPLMVELVEDFTNQGDVICDWTAGSGTTGVAALRTGRRFIGFEKDLGFFETARERLRAEESGSTYMARASGQTALFAPDVTARNGGGR